MDLIIKNHGYQYIIKIDIISFMVFFTYASEVYNLKAANPSSNFTLTAYALEGNSGVQH